MKIDEIKKENYQGCDASLDTSLFEYGLAVKTNDDGTYDIIYGVESDEGQYVKFEIYSQYSESDFPSDMGWFQVSDVARFSGLTEDEYLKQPMLMRLSDAVAYYGYNNMFGETYSSFEIE
jgi:hypothetical protein